MAVRAVQRDTVTAAAHFIEQGRLPRPSTRTRVRKEVVLRPATAQDAAACALLDSTYTTTHVWQLDARHDAEELRVSLRWLRLPRELTLVAPHAPPALPPTGGALRRGALWLVAEEIEIGGLTPAREAEAAPAVTPSARPAPWNHAIRRTSGGATVQLSFPDGDKSERRHTEGPAPIAGRIVGYAVVACAPRDRNAYLRTLVIDRAHRRKGTGSRLLAEAKRWAVRQGAGCLIADAPARNFPAIRLLQRAGFAFCGYNDSCYVENEVAVFFCARLR